MGFPYIEKIFYLKFLMLFFYALLFGFHIVPILNSQRKEFDLLIPYNYK